MVKLLYTDKVTV